MIKTDPPADKKFIQDVQKARNEFVEMECNLEYSNHYGYGIRFNPWDFQDPDFVRFHLMQLFNKERDIIYNAVVKSPGEWNTFRSRFTFRSMPELYNRQFELGLRVDTHVGDAKVYIPVYESMSMPKDVFKCDWCGGYTKNDKRGHCAGCGGPRNEKYLEE